jgi:hypothetical protein
MKAKITRATVKSFINKHDELFIKEVSNFDGMIDGLHYNSNPGFRRAKKATSNHDYNLGIKGAWFVGSSRDYFNKYEDDQFIGIEVYNSCGSFVIAKKKTA